MFSAHTSQFVHHVENGASLSYESLEVDGWSNVILIDRAGGLEMKMPPDHFDVSALVELLGRQRMVKTIDVYRQQECRMSLGRFYDIWKQRDRPRLYNILSLEFSRSL
jgi:lysine-specific demethylase PHF8